MTAPGHASPLTRRSCLAGLLAAPLALTTTEPARALRLLKMSTIGLGTSASSVVGEFASTVNAELPDVEITVNHEGPATRHVIELALGRLEFCTSSPAIHARMRNKTAVFRAITQSRQLLAQLRTVMNFPLGVYHIAVSERSGIERLEEVAGKKVFLGPQGAASFTTMAQLLSAAVGLAPTADYETVALGWDDGAAAFRRGEVDVFCVPTNAPSPLFQDMVAERPLRFLGLPDEPADPGALEDIVNWPGHRLATLPAGVYGDHQADGGDARTLGITASLLTRANLERELVYRATKTFFDAIPTQAQNKPWLANVTPDGALDDLNLPLHEGAIDALTEHGLTIPDEARPTPQER
ncbi:MAG: TAXI family TRAP transporter solute-binding subunit [Pseudomonadota bacterium]